MTRMSKKSPKTALNENQEADGSLDTEATGRKLMSVDAGGGSPWGKPLATRTTRKFYPLLWLMMGMGIGIKKSKQTQLQSNTTSRFCRTQQEKKRSMKRMRWEKKRTLGTFLVCSDEEEKHWTDDCPDGGVNQKIESFYQTAHKIFPSQLSSCNNQQKQRGKN
uniref:Uncharacterized protein n=1 Tax=Leersia perrieri TaxID=77586 RepID=A0A0D9Y0V1_9ORYZ